MIGADGKYVEDARVVNVTDTMGGGAETNGAAYARAQTALAVSLVTGRRGPTGKGRFYLPCPTALHDDTFLISAAAAEGVRASAVTLINDLNNLPGLDSFPSFGVVVASSKGYNTPVTGVRVGRVVDVIRSRRSSIAEAYTTVAAVAS